MGAGNCPFILKGFFMSSGIIGGNVFAICAVNVTIDIASVAAATTAEQTFTVQGTLPGDFVLVSPASTLNAGLGIVNARVAAVNTVTLRIINATAGALDPASAVVSLLVFRPESFAGAVTTG